jgi:hypothetical protein
VGVRPRRDATVPVRVNSGALSGPVRCGPCMPCWDETFSSHTLTHILRVWCDTRLANATPDSFSSFLLLLSGGERKRRGRLSNAASQPPVPTQQKHTPQIEFPFKKKKRKRLSSGDRSRDSPSHALAPLPCSLQFFFLENPPQCGVVTYLRDYICPRFIILAVIL